MSDCAQSTGEQAPQHCAGCGIGLWTEGEVRVHGAGRFCGVDKDSANYKAWLDELLAVIHRDGGQYTQLTGYLVSLQDAQKKVQLLRQKVSSMLFKPGRR